MTLFQHGTFSGKSGKFGLGSHDIDVIRKTIGNDQVSSLYVRSGYEARLFEHGRFSGKEVVFGPGGHNIGTLRSRGFKNDDLSSMIVQ